ncbi:MAG: hypothetical protein ABSC72_05840 [Methylovirgula sp.]|jgi:hypothetical protein
MRKVEAFQLALGRFVLEWSGMEFSLDLLVLASWKLQTPKRAKPPHNLSGKLDAIREVARGEKLASFALAIDGIAREIEAMADERHDYIHGASVQMFEAERPFSVSLGRLLQPRNRPRRRPVKVTAADLNKAANRARSIGDRTLDLAESVNKLN